MLPYPIDSVLACLQLVLGGALLLVVVPWLLSGRVDRRPFGPHLFDHVSLAIVVIGLLVPALSMVRLLDGVSLVTAIVLIGAVGARARGVQLGTAWSGAWRRAASFVLDLSEGHRRRPRLPPLRRLDPGPGRRVVAAAGVAVVGVAAFASLGDAIAHAGPDVAGHATRVLRLGDLALRHPFADGVHHLGVESVLSAVSRVVRVDNPLLVRLSPGFAELAIVLGVLWAAWRITDRAVAGVVSAAVIAVVVRSTWWPLTSVAGDQMAVAAAAALAAPTMAAVVDVVRGRARPLVVLLGVGAASLLHPVVGGLLAIIVLGGCAVSLAAGSTPPARIAPATAIGAAIGWLPISLGLALGHPWDHGPFGVTGALRSATTTPPDLGRPSLVLVLAVVSAAALAFAPERQPGRRVLAAGVLVAVLAVEPFRFGLADPLAPGVAAIVASTAIALGAGVLIAAFARRDALVLAFAVLAIAAGLPLPPAIDRLEPADVVAERIRDVDSSHPPFTWTIIAEPSAFTDVPATGFFIGAPSFIGSYDPSTWRFDPDQPELAVPTRFVYLLVHDEVGPTVSNETGATGGDRALDELMANDTAEAGAPLQAWVDRYRATHSDITVRWHDQGLTVFKISRSQADELRIVRANQVEHERRRSGATSCRAVGDHLIFPTPRAFEVCE